MLTVKNKIDSHQLIKVAEFRKDIRNTAPHKHHSYFEFVWLAKGAGWHTIDGKRYAVDPPVLFIIRKEQIHHWELEGEPEGYVLIIKKQYVDDSLDKSLQDILRKASIHTCLHIPEPGAVASLFALLLREWEQTLPHRNEVMEGLLKALLAKVLQYARADEHQRGVPTDMFQRFEALLAQTHVLKNSVAHYAALLNTTPQNLNAVCRRAAGQSAAAVLAGHLTSEAKRLLLYTDMTVSQIAAQLDFGDSSHFIKYFKRHTGTTPVAFRRLA
ncbi:AraC-type DNA-binding protein [Parapedobacter composti]|uniref:AraC-type DNA-binding protein n=1 Tax=Parapedobacter composti TaxID=623281 RepID=A0A1I1GFQ6_9SPHI|nr:helix-turn-helix transcriptional regulator [Parapedobacter composti]SFC08173.1 AraC-type DNA-binding protein [Parapedobacter composti]